MKIKTNILMKMIIVSILTLCFTGCESDINIEKQSDNISKTESIINNDVYYIEVENNKKIPFIQKENIEILDIKVENSTYAPSCKDIKTQFINNSNVELRNVGFTYNFENKSFLSMANTPTPSKEIATTNLTNLDLFFLESLNNFNDYIDNIENYITSLSYEIREDDVTVDITYEYKTGMYRISTKETTDKNYYKDYTYYPKKNDISLISEYNDEIPKAEDYISLDLNEKDNIQNESNNEEIKNNSSNKKLNINSVEYGELLDVYQDEGLVIIKAKIDYAYSKKSTINQNGFNIEHIIDDNDIEGIDEIQYWAVADTGGAYDEKVISFTMNKNLINKVKNGSVAGAYIIDEASDVWIHPSLI